MHTQMLYSIYPIIIFTWARQKIETKRKRKCVRTMQKMQIRKVFWFAWHFCFRDACNVCMCVKLSASSNHSNSISFYRTLTFDSDAFACLFNDWLSNAFFSGDCKVACSTGRWCDCIYVTVWRNSLFRTRWWVSTLSCRSIATFVCWTANI